MMGLDGVANKVIFFGVFAFPLNYSCLKNKNKMRGEGLKVWIKTSITVFVNLRLSLVSYQYMDHNNMV